MCGIHCIACCLFPRKPKELTGWKWLVVAQLRTLHRLSCSFSFDESVATLDRVWGRLPWLFMRSTRPRCGSRWHAKSVRDNRNPSLVFVAVRRGAMERQSLNKAPHRRETMACSRISSRGADYSEGIQALSKFWLVRTRRQLTQTRLA